DLKKVYDLSDIVINPLTVGTGLKIKMIEAMGLSKAVISTKMGAEGIDGRDRAYLPAESSNDYLDHLNKLFQDHHYYRNICSNARELAGTYNRQITDQLMQIFQ
ncbi:MAG: glycosyltransferase family 4 protein, partial [Thermodesulfobacteriota bacterium]